MTVLGDYAAALTGQTLPIGPSDPDGGTAPRYDEVIAPGGGLRPAWKAVASSAVALTSERLAQVDDEITGFLADDGVTYAAPGGRPRPWRLDPVPLVIDAPTWARLEVGLAQRAELLNALLADIYGSQQLLAEGILPAAAVFGHAGYTRVLVRPGGDPHPLLLSATDLGRDADGGWRVIRDRVQAPSGLGYAGENRRVISRVLPDLYTEAGLHSIQPYYSALRSALLQAAPGERSNPRVVVLSPGTSSETAYDQAFLASTLGFPLVQGEDLVVHSGRVWMKPAGWPQVHPSAQVDVILRRVDAEWCDPLELRGDSQLGVPGLIETVRRGNVRLVNGLGAGVLENPALLAFMPAVCERLLGEQLRLESVPTWWCGTPQGLDEVLDRLATAPGGLLVRTLDGPSTTLAGLTAPQLAERILATPHRYVGQERLALSQAPAWEATAADGPVAPRPLSLRTFTLRDGAAYRPLLGGMATIVDPRERRLVTKDVWVLKSSPADPDQGLAQLYPLTVIPSAPATAPRALEDLLWSGRYAERAEDLLRLVLTVDTVADAVGGDPGEDPAVRALLAAAQRLAGSGYADLDSELRSLVLDAGRPGSVGQSLAGLRESLEGVRDQLSNETWRVFSQADRAAAALQRSSYGHQIAESAGRMLTGILSLHGVTANMIRDAGWHMIEAGRYLERGLQLCSLLAATTTSRWGAEADREVLDQVLAAAESSVTHRRRYRGYTQTAGVLDLLLNDQENPRSLGFALARLREHLAALPASTGSTRPERLVEQLSETLASTDPASLLATVEEFRPGLAQFFDQTQAALRQLADAITDLHFAAGPAPRAISSVSLTELSEGPQ